MRFVTFNVNGIRARLHQIEAVKERHQPDVLALQETKVVDEAFPHEAVEEIGFPHRYIYGQKGHYGVALLSKVPLSNVQYGVPWRSEDQQRRFIAADYPSPAGPVRVLNGYYPQGESRDHPTKFPAKAEFYADVARFLGERCSSSDLVVLGGDMNVAPQDEDIGIGDDNRKRWLRTGKSSFLPEEREWLASLLDWGLEDCYRAFSEKESLFSWFDYRSRGFERDPKRGLRIDLILASRALHANAADCGIDYEIRGMDKPSDHCPVWCNYAL